MNKVDNIKKYWHRTRWRVLLLTSAALTGPGVLFQLMGAGASPLLPQRGGRAGRRHLHQPGHDHHQQQSTSSFILMAGAPSHVDTFDFKMTPGVTPTAAAPQTVNGILWPTGILPKLGAMTNQFSLVRSVQAHALVHSLGQTWVQIGRNPAASLGNIAPNIGSIVALEKVTERKPGHVLPTFLALNSDGAATMVISTRPMLLLRSSTTAGLPIRRIPGQSR
jgi:hypothetical protein